MNDKKKNELTKYFLKIKQKSLLVSYVTFIEEFCRAEVVRFDEHVDVERVGEAIVDEQLARRLSAHHVVVVVAELDK